jgi:glucose-1-phosphate thymidylyltransferase
MRGIILAGGTGTRLFPATQVVSKQLMPVYDKPMIYYPLSVLMLGGIRDILVITTPHEQYQFKNLLGDGSQWGLKFSYAVQPKPEGLAQALIIGEEFANGEPVTLILGDNIFYGQGFVQAVEDAFRYTEGATVFGYWVHNPVRYGVVEFDREGNVLSVEEKPEVPRSNYAITGLYCYDGHAAEYARMVKPSRRGELEITELNAIYLERKALRVQLLGRGVAWLDTGTHYDMLQASHFISTVQSRQGLLIASPEEIAFRKRYISSDQLRDIADGMRNNSYGQALLWILDEEDGGRRPH